MLIGAAGTIPNLKDFNLYLGETLITKEKD